MERRRGESNYGEDDGGQEQGATAADQPLNARPLYKPALLPLVLKFSRQACGQHPLACGLYAPDVFP